MKRILSLILCFIFILSLCSCGGMQEAETERTETYKSVCVDIGVNEDGYYGLMGDVDIHYNGDDLGYIYIDNPCVLAFSVSSERGGGVWLLDLDDGYTAIDELTAIAEALKENGQTDYADKIDSVIAIMAKGGPLTKAST